MRWSNGQSARLAFDWFDAAVLSHQLGQHLAKELKALFAEESSVRVIGLRIATAVADAD